MINAKQNTLFPMGKPYSQYEYSERMVRSRRKECNTGQEIASLVLTMRGSALIILRNGLSVHRLDGAV